MPSHRTGQYGNYSGTTGADGTVSIPHGMSHAPAFAQVGLRGDNVNGVDVQSVTATHIVARVKNAAGADVTSTAVVIDWQARG